MKLRSLLLVGALLVSACEKRMVAPPPPQPTAERRAEPHVERRRPPTANAEILGRSAPAEPAADRPPPRTLSLESYSVTVAANETLEMPGPPGELRVWIGVSSLAPRRQPGMKAETLELGAVGKTARVHPFALGMEVEPKESLCEKIAPDGSEVRFTLKPGKIGVFTVGADVALYDTPECSGPPVPKTAKSVTVNVVVSAGNLAREGAAEAGGIVWRHVLELVGGAAALVCAAILWRLRKKILKLFGYPGT